MKKFSLFVCSLFIMIPLLQAKDVKSDITTISIYQQGAIVSRSTKVDVTTGIQEIVFTRLAFDINPASIQAKGWGDFTILGISERKNYLNENQLPEKLQQLQDSIELLQEKIKKIHNQLAAIQSEEQLLKTNMDIKGTQVNLTVAELKAMTDFYRTKNIELGDLKLKHQTDEKKWNNQINKLKNQLDELAPFYPKNTSEIVVEVLADKPTKAHIEISYLALNASWYPEYDIRSDGIDKDPAITFKAIVQQNTGEVWEKVNIKLATGNPNMSMNKPQLYPWQLYFQEDQIQTISSRNKMAPSVAYSMMEMKASEDDMEEAGSFTNYVQQSETTLSNIYTIQLPYSLPSQGKETTVEIKEISLKAQYAYACVPKLDRDAFLLAKVTGWDEHNFMAGKMNIFFEGAYVGESYLDPSITDDTLQISLGRDGGISVVRTQNKDFTGTKFIGTKKRQTFAYTLEVRNTKKLPIKITIEDHLPISTNSEIEVTPAELSGANFEKDSGKLTWQLLVSPSETKKFNYQYEIAYPKDRRINL